MKRSIILVVLSLFMCGITKITIAGDIYGYVYDADGKGLPGVKISSKDDHKTYSEQTSGSGSYYLALSIGAYTIKYEKEGYQTQMSDISILKDERKYIEMIIMIANQAPVH